MYVHLIRNNSYDMYTEICTLKREIKHVTYTNGYSFLNFNIYRI